MPRNDFACGEMMFPLCPEKFSNIGNSCFCKRMSFSFNWSCCLAVTVLLTTGVGTGNFDGNKSQLYANTLVTCDW